MEVMREYKDRKGMEAKRERSMGWVLDVNDVFGKVIKLPAA